MNSDWLEAFLAFSDTLNFTRAAEQLYISQPALHVKIAKLSEYVGKPLYQKTGRNLLLTAEGKKLQAFAREQGEQAQNFLSWLREGESTGSISLCAGEGAFLYLLEAAVSAFTRKESSSLHVKVGDQQKVLDTVLSGEAHIGVTPVDTAPDDLICHPLTKVGQVLVMPASHALAKKRKLKLGDLKGKKLIVPLPDRPHRILVNRLLMDAEVEWEAAIEVNGWELMINFVKQGLGLAIVNEYCTIPRGLVARPLPAFPALQFHLVLRRHAAKNAGVDTLKKMLLENKDSWKSK